MGLLDWRGWDRLDELDRRTGFRRRWTEAAVVRTERFLWVLTALVLLLGVINIVERDWVWAVILLVTGFVSLFTNRRTIERIRKQAGL